MGRQRVLTLAAAAAVLLATGVSVLIARSGDPSPAAAPAASSAHPPVSVVVPGRPGESAAVTDSDQVRAPDGSTYNRIDVTFVQMMMVHHQQAVTMADLAPGRVANKQLGALAERISLVQKPERELLRAWLTKRKLPETDPGHDHSTMPGMQTDAALAELAAARGADFDRRFVAMMTAHHRGAQQMAGDVMRGGTDLLLSEMANEMAVEQGSEIRRMEQLRVG
jgi:uncharacterized protein (DUF305 family)